MQPGFPAPQLVGQCRTFGPFGPAYRIVEPVKQIESGDWVLRIQMLETGEETEYAYSRALNDPEAR